MAKHRYTDKQIFAAIERNKGLVFLAAQQLGCYPSTIHHRAIKNNKIRECIEIERGRILDFAEAKLLEAVGRGEAWAICFLLKTQGKGRGYVERQEIKAEARIAITNNIEEISDEQLEFLITRELAAIPQKKIGPEVIA